MIYDREIIRMVKIIKQVPEEKKRTCILACKIDGCRIVTLIFYSQISTLTPIQIFDINVQAK